MINVPTPKQCILCKNAVAGPAHALSCHKEYSNSTVSTPAARTLDRIHNLAPQILDDVWDIANSVAVGEKVPAAGAIAVVVEPGTEDKVCRGGEKETVVSS